jgi:hypothetical protein
VAALQSRLQVLPLLPLGMANLSREAHFKASLFSWMKRVWCGMWAVARCKSISRVNGSPVASMPRRWKSSGLRRRRMLFGRHAGDGVTRQCWTGQVFLNELGLEHAQRLRSGRLLDFARARLAHREAATQAPRQARQQQQRPAACGTNRLGCGCLHRDGLLALGNGGRRFHEEFQGRNAAGNALLA